MKKILMDISKSEDVEEFVKDKDGNERNNFQIRDYFLFIPTFFTKLVLYSFFVIWFLVGLYSDIRDDNLEYTRAMTPLLIAIMTMLFHLEYRDNIVGDKIL